MKFVIIMALALISSLVAFAPANAHRPYFTQVEKILLPDGEVGEVRLLNGDGIFGPDPVRAIILDAQGHLLARSQKSTLMSIHCSQMSQCLVIDLTKDNILDLDPSSFRQAGSVPGLTDQDRSELWELEDGKESWGFAPRNPKLQERFITLKLIFAQRLLVISFNVVIGIVCGLLFSAILVVKRTERRGFTQLLLAAIAILVIVALGLSLTAVSGLASLIGGLPIHLWLLSVATGGGLFYSGRLVLKGRRSRTASTVRFTP